MLEEDDALPFAQGFAQHTRYSCKQNLETAIIAEALLKILSKCQGDFRWRVGAAPVAERFALGSARNGLKPPWTDGITTVCGLACSSLLRFQPLLLRIGLMVA